MFPNPRQTTTEGLLAVGGHLGINTLKEAYANGIFPWPQEGLPLLWFSPDPRGVIDFNEMTGAQSFYKWKKKSADQFELTINQAFTDVIHQCRLARRPHQAGSWILPEMETAYTDLFTAGWGISVECWQSKKLVAGIYGVKATSSGGVAYVSLESMFYKISNTSKLALWSMLTELQKQGYTWVDIQMVTDVTSQFGGKYISKEEFLARLRI